ncbi:MAG: glucosyl-3-phosphoglycerate synthase [Chloroflexi bacterium]|nr:glucosyl-3-phosphoglycerate synthase [Chloroflexota bacterium]
MKSRYSASLFRKILVPIVYGSSYDSALQAALNIADESCVLLVGIVGISSDESLSKAAVPARHLRKLLRETAAKRGVDALQRIHVSHEPWEELIRIVLEEEPDLVILQPSFFDGLKITLGEALRFPPCDMVIASGQISESPAHVLVSLRGGPYAELSLRLGLSISSVSHSRLTALHILPAAGEHPMDPAFKGMERVLKNLPEVKRMQIHTNDPVQAILETSKESDLVVLGATARPKDSLISIGPVADAILRESSKGVLIVKSRRPLPSNMDSEVVGRNAISVLVDKWFAENTYHAGEFADLDLLLESKRKQNLTISLALPALDEEETVGQVIKTIKQALMGRVDLVDEMILVDSDSSDRTREIAAELDVPVYIHQQVLPVLGPRTGKGEALWKSLYLTRGDILVWIDTDIVNVHPRFVYGLLGPLILHPEIQFVKGFYRRPLKVDNKLQAGGGGRVTELTARPLLNLFFPELSGLIQPLSGEYGGRRSALEQLQFSSGYGVETGLLIDVFEKFGLSAIAQVDLQERVHHNQPLESLSKMSFAIIQTIVRRIEKRYGMNMLEDVNKSLKLIRYEQGRLFLDVEEIAELERPAMIELQEYRERVLNL